MGAALTAVLGGTLTAAAGLPRQAQGAAAGYMLPDTPIRAAPNAQHAAGPPGQAQRARALHTLPRIAVRAAPNAQPLLLADQQLSECAALTAIAGRPAVAPPAAACFAVRADFAAAAGALLGSTPSAHTAASGAGVV